MTKNNVFMKHIKRTLSVLLAVVVIVALSGCAESADKNPVGGLSTTQTYATNGNYSITVGDLYDEIKKNSLSYLNQRIEEATFDDYLNLVSKSNDEHKQLVAEYILTDIHGTFDEEEIEKLSLYTREYAIYQYIDTLMMEGYELSYNLLNHTTIDGILGSSAFDTLWNKYKINVAKYLYAFDVLTQEIKEHNEDAKEDDDLDEYFTDSDIANFFDNNYSYEGDVDLVLIKFTNQNEANSVLKKFGIKSYNGEWYLIQPPKDEAGKTDYSKWANESDYNKYYDEYTISQSSSTSSDSPISVLGTDTTILKMFVEVYNYIYTYRNSLTYPGKITNVTANDTSGASINNTHFLYYYRLMLSILEQDKTSASSVTYDQLVSLLTSDSNLNFTKDKLDSHSTSLTSYVHSTLSTVGEEDEDGIEGDYVQYTATSRSYNSNYYLLYKLTDAVDKEFYTLEEDEDGEEYYVFDEKILASEFNSDSDLTLYNQIMKELFDNKLTSSYISTKASERSEYITVEIYDSTIDLEYSMANTSYTGTKGTENDIIARIIFKDKYSDSILIDGGDNTWEIEVTVLETYEKLEPIFGPTTSVALLFDKHITTTTYYSDIKNEDDYYQDYKDQIYMTLNYFANDMYSSYGYPATMGKYNFMKSFYGTAIVDEAIEYLVVQQAKTDFFLDIDDSFYTKMYDFTNMAYENFFSLSISNINIYVDRDEDGIPDADWFNVDDNSDFSSSFTVAEKKALVEELVSDIENYLYNSTASLVDSFAAVVEEFNNSTRIEPTDNDYPLSGSTEATWAKYRKHGILISTSSLGDFTDTSTGQDEEIKNIIDALYNDENSEIIFNNTFTGSYYISEEMVLNDDGYNILLVTAGAGKTEIDYKNEDSDLYTNVPIKIGDSYKIYDDLTSSGVTANEVQVEVFCREYFATGSSTSLSSSATTYLSTYLTPVLTKYNSEVVQIMIMSNVLGNINSTVNTNISDDLTKYIELLQRVSDDYVNTTEYNYSTYTYEGFWDYIDTLGGSN